MIRRFITLFLAVLLVPVVAIAAILVALSVFLAGLYQQLRMAPRP